MPRMKITPEEIEEINAYGPFNHSVWRGRGISVTNEERLAGRAAFLGETIRTVLLKTYGAKKLATKNIVDVGCYDGLLLHSLEDFPFRELVGIEPRNKNIEKGKKIRKLLGIRTRVKFRQAAIETLPKKKYDIVLCIGTFHHLESIPLALRKLDAICRDSMIIETLCLPKRHETAAFKRDIEMKDVIYRYKKPIAGLTGHKFESSYYDGSTARTTVVSVPSIRTLLMYFDTLGYEARIIARPSDFKRAMPKNERPSQEVLIFARKKRARLEESVLGHISNYEYGLMNTILPREIIEPLYDRYCLGKRQAVTGVVRAIANHIDNPAKRLGGLSSSLGKSTHALEIAKALRFNPFEKIALEYGKLLRSEKRVEEAANVLRSVTERPNADWRATYRSFYLLSKIYAFLGDRGMSQRYKKRCRAANPDFTRLMDAGKPSPVGKRVIILNESWKRHKRHA